MKTSKYLDIRVLVLLAMMGVPVISFAGTTGTEFLTFYTWISGIVSGYFGRAVAIAAVAIGAMISVAKSNPMPILVGIGFAVFLSYGPTVINGILSATI